ncbi:YbgA family protein [Deferrisoma palaeochoriense]
MSHRRLRVLVSACLLGEPVRYDGGHKREPGLEALAEWVEWVPVCPERHLGVPREAVDLVGDPEAPRAVGVETGQDRTAELTARFGEILEELGRTGADAAVLKARSPSCAVGSARVYAERPREGEPAPAPGLFAAALARRFPLLPRAEEEALRTPWGRAAFFRRALVLRRWREARAGAPGLGPLRAFHRREKYNLMAHGQAEYRRLGPIVAGARPETAEAAWEAYEAALLTTLATAPTPASHANVLQHLAGYFRRRASPAERARLAEAIETFRGGTTPLGAVLALVRDLARRYDVAYLLDQTYLWPHPLELEGADAGTRGRADGES